MADNLIEALENIDKRLSAWPWSACDVDNVIRHGHQSIDVRKHTIECQDAGELTGLPNKCDGKAIAVLRNKLPDIIKALKAAA